MVAMLNRKSLAVVGIAALALAAFSPSVSTAAEVVELHGDLPANLSSIPTTHQQSAIISLDSKMRLADFCLTSDGRILALANGEAQPGLLAGIVEAIGGKPTDASGKKSELHVYDRDGKLLRKWTVDFEAQAINAGPDGSIFVGGDGELARYDAQGSLIAQMTTPQAKVIRDDPEALKQQATEHMESEQASIADMLKSFKDQKEQLDAKDQDKLTDEDKQFAVTYKPSVQAYEQYLDTLKKKTIEQAMAEIAQRVMRINAIAVGENDLFVACPATKGFGYCVWRADKDLKKSEQIISGLSGCCGQMDIQYTGDKLYVAENSRHRVVCYDRDGKELSSFGKRDREGMECFGGCCNPMNLCFTKQGTLYVAESNGLVKHFTPLGEYQGLVGVAKVPAGCKNSAIAATVEGDRVYYIDITNSKIIVLARIEKTADAGK